MGLFPDKSIPMIPSRPDSMPLLDERPFDAARVAAARVALAAGRYVVDPRVVARRLLDAEHLLASPPFRTG